MFEPNLRNYLIASSLCHFFASTLFCSHSLFAQSLRNEFTQKETSQVKQEDETIANIANDYKSLGLVNCFNLKGSYPMSSRRLPGEGVYAKTPDLRVRFENMTPGYDKFCISKDGNIYQRFIHTTHNIWIFLKLPLGEEVLYSGPDGNPLGFYERKSPVLLKAEKSANGNFLFSYKHVKAPKPGSLVECSLKIMSCAFKANIYDEQARLGQFELVNIDLIALKQNVLERANAQAKLGLKTSKGDTILSPSSF